MSARFIPSAAIVLLAMTTTLAAQDLSASRANLLKQLGAADYAARQQATRTLLAGDYLDDATLRRMLRAAGRPEQRHRLLAVARHHTIRRFVRQTFAQPQPGAIGVRHQPLPAEARPGADDAAVLIVATIPGFPGHERFEAGDRLIALNGEPFDESVSSLDLPRRIKAYQRGDQITATVIRRGKKMTVNFTLAGAAALAAAHDPETGNMSRPFTQPWLERRARLLEGIDLSEPLPVE